LAQDLLAAGALDDLVAEARPLASKLSDEAEDVIGLDHESVPTAGLGLASVGHRPGSRGPRPRDPEREIAALQDRHCRTELLLEGEAEVPAIEGHRFVDVAHHVADRGHGEISIENGRRAS